MRYKYMYKFIVRHCRGSMKHVQKYLTRHLLSVQFCQLTFNENYIYLLNLLAETPVATLRKEWLERLRALPR